MNKCEKCGKIMSRSETGISYLCNECLANQTHYGRTVELIEGWMGHLDQFLPLEDRHLSEEIQRVVDEMREWLES